MWRGFVVESKSYMSYDKRDIKGKIKFWLRFPIALYKFLKFERR